MDQEGCLGGRENDIGGGEEYIENKEDTLYVPPDRDHLLNISGTEEGLPDRNRGITTTPSMRKNSISEGTIGDDDLLSMKEGGIQRDVVQCDVEHCGGACDGGVSSMLSNLYADGNNDCDTGLKECSFKRKECSLSIISKEMF